MTIEIWHSVRLEDIARLEEKFAIPHEDHLMVRGIRWVLPAWLELLTATALEQDHD